MLDLVNQYRASGYDCGSGGNLGPAAPLTMQPNLRCAARVHSKDMDERNFFDHTNPSGESPFDRMGMAGYSLSTAGENTAGGSPGAAGTMDQWHAADFGLRGSWSPARAADASRAIHQHINNPEARAIQGTCRPRRAARRAPGPLAPVGAVGERWRYFQMLRIEDRRAA